MSFTLPKLQYSYEALEPHIDTETMKTHHTGHHQAYVNNLNTIVTSGDIKYSSLFNLISNIKNRTDLKEEVKQSLINNAGGHYNHSLFWLFMCPSSTDSPPSRNLLDSLESSFGGFDRFKASFEEASLKVFGSGWVWLCYSKKGKTLSIVTTVNQDNPIMSSEDLITILGLDVWEHAYYLKFKNLRKEYIKSWWNVVNWKLVSELFEKYALQGKDVEVTDGGLIH